MLPEVLLSAIRIQSIDVANMSGQIAVFRAHTEQISEALAVIDERSWEHRTPSNDEDSKSETVLPPDQEMALLRLLTLCRSVS